MKNLRFVSQQENKWIIKLVISEVGRYPKYHNLTLKLVSHFFSPKEQLFRLGSQNFSKHGLDYRVTTDRNTLHFTKV